MHKFTLVVKTSVKITLIKMVNFNPKTPYNNLPDLPQAADIETKKILRKTISAGRALAQLNGTLLNLPTLHYFWIQFIYRRLRPVPKLKT